MKCYYIMIHFAGGAVTGFIVPQAVNEDAALKILKKSLVCRIIMRKKKESSYCIGEESLDRLKAFLAAVRRPWRYTKEKFGQNSYRLVNIEELYTPVIAGYWLSDILVGSTICNIRSSTWEPRPKG